MTNPFAQPAPVQPQAPAQPGNPFGPATPAQPPAPAPAQQPTYGVQGQPAWLAQPQQAPAPAQPQQQPQQAAAVPQLPTGGFGNAAPPPPAGDGKGALLPDMFGRLVLIFPHELTNEPRNPAYISQEDRARGNVTQDKLTATVVVLDDGQGGNGPIWYGGKPYGMPPSPHTEQGTLPYVRRSMWLRGRSLIAQCRDYLPGGSAVRPGVPGMVLGRVTKAGPAQTDPWYLLGAEPADEARANYYLEAVQRGQFPNPLAPSA